MAGPSSTERVLAFCHVPKAAGTTWIHLLRRHFGVRHVDVIHRRRRARDFAEYLKAVYRLRDLRWDLRIYPGAASLAGHPLRPFVKFDEFQDRLVWYAILRNPLKRYLSQYQQGAYRRGRPRDFPEWARVHGGTNFQVHQIAGEDDVEAAKQILASRFRTVGLVEQFNATLLVFRRRLGLGDMNLVFERPKNVGRPEDREQALEEFEKHRELALEHNAGDIALYEFVRDELWPKQVADYGGEECLQQDLATQRQHSTVPLAERCRHWANVAKRNLIYKPLARLQREPYPP